LIKGRPLKTDATMSIIYSAPRRVALETLYAALLISTKEQLFSSIKVLPKGVSNAR
jgi:hypothetical protein